MSHQVTVDFEGVTIQIQSQCEVVSHSLSKIDKVLNRIHETANRLETSKVREYEAYLLDSKKKIQSLINSFVESLEKYKVMKKQTFDTDTGYGDQRSRDLVKQFNELNVILRNKGVELTNTVNELIGTKLAVIDQMINEGLLNAGQSSAQDMLNKINGVLSFEEKILQKINEVDDVSLRELAYRELLKDGNSALSFEDIISKAQEQYDILLNKKTAHVIAEYKSELESSGVNASILDKVSTIEEATKVTNEAITDEKVRKEILKVIIKAIKERGFIVDTKNNLKIDRERNIVKLVALKASGQIAEFEIQLNGKFMYHFDGYEGLACNKDINPFMEDLKKIYDINVLYEEVQWSNPDKISTQKYQCINTKKGTK